MKRITRADIVDEARRWIGTPFQHQASLRGVGCDCLGLLRGVWRALYGEEPEAIPSYGPAWALASHDELFLAGLQRHFVVIAPNSAAAGDVVLFRMRAHFPASHAAILADGSSLVHAHDGANVAEIAFANAWRRRLGGAFSFPGLID